MYLTLASKLLAMPCVVERCRPHAADHQPLTVASSMGLSAYRTKWSCTRPEALPTSLTAWNFTLALLPLDHLFMLPKNDVRIRRWSVGVRSAKQTSVPV